MRKRDLLCEDSGFTKQEQLYFGGQNSALEGEPCEPAIKASLLLRIKRKIYFALRSVINFIFRPERPLVNVLMMIIGFLCLICFALGVICVQLFISGRGNDLFAGQYSTNYTENDLFMKILQLYEATSSTGEKSHPVLFAKYLLKYKEVVENRTLREKMHADAVGYMESQKEDGSYLYLLEKYGADSAGELASLINKLKEKISLILSLEPDGKLDRLAGFLKKQFKVLSNPHVIGVEKVEEETEAFEPFDDILYLQLRRQYEKSGVGEGVNMSSFLLGLNWWRHVKATAPSVFTRRFYYPVRRYHAMQHFSEESVSVTASWFDAIVDDIYDGSSVTHFSPPALQGGYMSSVKKVLGKKETYSFAPDSPAHIGTLFVNIASYRDTECWPCVEHMIRRSTNFFRVYVGIAQQHNESDPPCVADKALEPHPCVIPSTSIGFFGGNAKYDGSVCFPADNIRIRTVSPLFAKGPTYGRHLAMLLYRGEDYMMVIDSHTFFTYAWDKRIMTLFMSMQHPRAVLSHYPHAFERNEENKNGTKFSWERSNTPYLCRARFLEKEGFVRLGSRHVHPNDYKRNETLLRRYEGRGLRLRQGVARQLPQPWAAAGFLFANSSIMRHVPFDPHLPCIFDGEEVMYSVRLWTHGYDIYSPTKALFFHVYGRKATPKVWSEESQWYSIQKFSLRRIQYFLQSRVKGVDVLRVPKNTNETTVMIDADRYGPGRVRRVEEWYTFAGVDPVRYTLDGRWCGLTKETKKASTDS